MPSKPARKLAGIASSPWISIAKSTPVLSIALRTHSTSGLFSADGACHSRLRLTPTALVRRWPRREPSGFMLGTTRKVQSLRSTPAMGEAGVGDAQPFLAVERHHRFVVGPAVGIGRARAIGDPQGQLASGAP